MAYDHQAHLKLDDLQNKLDTLDRKIERLADGLDIPLDNEPIHVSKSVNTPLPRGAKNPNPFNTMQF